METIFTHNLFNIESLCAATTLAFVKPKFIVIAAVIVLFLMYKKHKRAGKRHRFGRFAVTMLLVGAVVFGVSMLLTEHEIQRGHRVRHRDHVILVGRGSDRDRGSIIRVDSTRRIDASGRIVGGHIHGAPPRETLTMRLDADRLDDYDITEASLADAAWTLLQKANERDEQGKIRLVELHKIRVAGEDDETVRIEKLGKLAYSRRPRRDRSEIVLGFNIKLVGDTEDWDGDLTGVALEMELVEKEVSADNRVLSHVIPRKHDLEMRVRRDRLVPAGVQVDAETIVSTETNDRPVAADVDEVVEDFETAIDEATQETEDRVDGFTDQLENAIDRATAVLEQGIERFVTEHVDHQAEEAEARAERAADRAEQVADRAGEALERAADRIAEKVERRVAEAEDRVVEIENTVEDAEGGADAQVAMVATPRPADTLPVAETEIEELREDANGFEREFNEMLQDRDGDGVKDWVSQPPGIVGKSAYCKAVKVGPYASYEEAEYALLVEIHRETVRYMVEYLRLNGAGRLEIPNQYIRGQIVVDEWVETVDTSVADLAKEHDDLLDAGEMVTLHALMAFTPPVQRELSDYWRSEIVNSRLVWTGGLAGFVVLLLSTVFSYLKIDTATKGYYSGRLKLLATGILVLGAIVAGGFIDAFE